MRLRVRRLHPAAALPARAHPDDAGYDLCSVQAATLPPGGRATIGTGIALELPADHAGWVLPRSGLAARHGVALVNSPGLIDPGYRGEIRVVLLNTDRDQPFEVEPGMRVAQLVFAPFSAPVLVEARELGTTARGCGGFGSSGS